jgi:hypothetical protein
MTHFLVLFHHTTPDEEVVIAALQADFYIDMLSSCLPVTFDKVRSNTEKDELLQSEEIH